mgnify:CR=1 FL=1
MVLQYDNMTLRVVKFAWNDPNLESYMEEEIFVITVVNGFQLFIFKFSYVFVMHVEVVQFQDNQDSLEASYRSRDAEALVQCFC